MLFIDLEVYSDVSIQDVPIEVYANHPSTRVVLACAVFGDSRGMMTFSVTDESLRDTIQDAINYLVIYYCMKTEGK